MTRRDKDIGGCSLTESVRLPFWVLVLVFTSVAMGASKRPPGEEGKILSANSERDSLVSQAERLMRGGGTEEAIGLFARLVEAYPEDVHLLTRLGHACLKKGDFNGAQRAFEMAKKLDANLPEAYVGLGRVYLERPARGLQAYSNFRRAVGEAKRAIKIDSTYGPAYRLLGEGYERFEENHEKAAEHFMKYVALESDNPDGLDSFGLACIQAKQYDKIDNYVTPYLKEHPQEIRLIPLVAQAHFFLERYELALHRFERYLRTLNEQERQLYTDISLIASQKELQDYRATPEAERPAYLAQFWTRRDSDILTETNERMIEHYRRVWYARTFFADGVYPWDRRGEVYIRYGEPDYRSRSTLRQFVQSPAVEAVRTRMAVRIYGPEAALLTFTGPVFPIRAQRDPLAASLASGKTEYSTDPSQENDPTPGTADAPAQTLSPTSINPLDKEESRFDEFGNPRTRLNFGGYAPLTIGNESGTVPWETWTYAQIGGGIEITFTDETGNGQFDFAPIPPPDADGGGSTMARIAEYAPSVVFHNAVSAVSDHYRPGFQHPPLEFYYDLAGFRALDGQTTLEVYFGIPPEQVKVAQQDNSAFMQVQCALALANADHTSIYRTASQHSYQILNPSPPTRGVFLPELLKMQAPPGRYELQVQIKDLISGHTGIYRQSVQLKDYPDHTLQISDIQLAAAITDSGSIDKFRKGDVWVVPMPTRNYREPQKLYAYYEVYNLKKNTFGQTRFSVRYLVRSVSKPIAGALGSVATGLRSLIKGKSPHVSVAYEQAGSEQTEREYIEIDLSKVKRGFNVLAIKVEDLVGGKTATREIEFQYGD